MLSRICILLFSIFLVIKSIDGQRRIFDGYNLRYNVHPYLVKLKIIVEAKHYNCSGSIIHSNWIITAAHCIMPDLSEIKVFHGIEEKVIATVDKDHAHRHPKYLDPYIIRDIGLLQITQGIKFDHHIKPIDLVTSEPARGTIGIIAGYGRHEYGVSAPREANVVIERCTDADSSTAVLCSNSLTGGSVGGGDSGGPLVYNGKLAGVISSHTSESFSLYRKEMYSVYSSIVKNSKWVNSVMNGKL